MRIMISATPAARLAVRGVQAPGSQPKGTPPPLHGPPATDVSLSEGTMDKGLDALPTLDTIGPLP